MANHLDPIRGARMLRAPALARPRALAARGIDGTSARQLDLMADSDQGPVPMIEPGRPPAGRRSLRLLRRDVFVELARRRRRAQIHARHLLERDETS